MMQRNMMTVLAVTVVAAGFALAQTTTAPAAPKADLNVRAAIRQQILKKLNLTADQKSQIKAIMQQAKTAAQPLQSQLEQNSQALTAAVTGNNTAQIQSLAAAHGSLRGQVLAIRSEAQAKVYAILTPDQQTALTQMEAKVKALRQQLKTL